MDLTNQKKQGQNKITTLNALNAALFSIKICPQEGVIAPDSNQLVISVGDKYAVLGSPKGEYKNYVYNLSKPLCYEEYYGEFHQEVKVINNEYVVKAYVEWSYEDGTEVEELEPNDIILFDTHDIISTNYQNVDIEVLYPTYSNFYKYFVNALTYNSDKKANKSLTMNDLYFKDSFTKTGNEINEEIDNLNVKCITSKNNKFSLDSDGNLTVNSITTNSSTDSNFDNNKIRDFIYPIGSIYMSVNNVNPTTLFGGTWVQMKDKFLLGAGDTYENGNIGGEATHTLTYDEMPQHNHGVALCGGSSVSASNTAINNHAKILGADASSPWLTNYMQDERDIIGKAGNSIAHNNMPPYLVVNMWKRTA